METEVMEVNRTISSLINDSLSDAQDIVTVSCRQSSTELLQCGTTRNNWALAAFRMVAMIQ